MECLIKTLASCLILTLFIYGIGFYGNGSHVFSPSLRLLQDTQWDFSFLWTQGAEKILAIFLLIPVSLGFLGWAVSLKKIFFPKIESPAASLLGFFLAFSFFSLYVFGLAINEILYGLLAFLFFIPVIGRGWREWNRLRHSWKSFWKKEYLFLSLPILLWFLEYFSPPLIWDAILDHFRYAREVSRLHQIPFHWTNHTGDMPKAAELVLAGFWSMGGENLSKFSSALGALGAILLLRLFLWEWRGNSLALDWIFWTCPFFLAIFSWGYVEGFLAVYEILAVYCLWKYVAQAGRNVWISLAAFFLGFAFSIKYTAFLALAALMATLVCWMFIHKSRLKPQWGMVILLLVPVLPWFLKGWEAYRNPFYPLLTSAFGTPYGYGPGMENGLWQDTGFPQGFGLWNRLTLFWKMFFTPANAVAACWTPLVFMGLPWGWKVFKSKLGFFLLFFAVFFFAAWSIFCTNLRHASGGTLVLVLLAAMAWAEGFKKNENGNRIVFGMGVALSLWLCLSAQLTATAPYASALGLEDPLLRLKRHYTYDTDTYSAYRFIEDHSDSRDKVMAFAVFQTYSLTRIAFVDFKWKQPIFLQWASQCQTAEQLARKLHEEGVRYFVYQKWEANSMSHVEKDFSLDGMSAKEYERFWQLFMVPVMTGENTVVYEVRISPSEKPRKLDLLPGLQEKGFWHPA